MKARFTGRYTQSAAAKHGKGTWNVADIIFTNSKCNGDLYKSFLNKCPHQKFQSMPAGCLARHTAMSSRDIPVRHLAGSPRPAACTAGPQ